MNNSRFEELLERYQQGKLAGREKQLMDEWFDDMANAKDHLLWTSDDKQKLKDNIIREICADQSANNNVRMISAPWVLRISASILFIVALSYVGWRMMPSQQLAESTAAGQISKILLPDGSIVWLKNESSLSYPKKFEEGTRHVTLKGEALFEVAKDAAHPFIVTCSDLTTTVLGTSFNIKSDDQDVEVVVLTGKVSITPTPGTGVTSKSVLIVPNKKAVYNKTKKDLATMIAQRSEEVALIKGTEYNMHFEDTRMDEIVQRIEGKFNVDMSLENARLGNCVVTADFTDQSLVKTLDILATVLAVDYELKDDYVMLKGNGCN